MEQTVQAIEKSVLPAISSTVKNAVDQQLANCVTGPTEKSLPKDMQTAVQEAVHKILLDSDGENTLSDAVGKTVVSKLGSVLKKEIADCLETVFKESLGPLVAKIETKLQTSLETSIQKIQEEQRTLQQELAKKVESLEDVLVNMYNQIQSHSANVPKRTRSRQRSPPQASTRKQLMADNFKKGNYSSGIEIVYLLDNETNHSGQLPQIMSSLRCLKSVWTLLLLFSVGWSS